MWDSPKASFWEAVKIFVEKTVEDRCRCGGIWMKVSELLNDVDLL